MPPCALAFQSNSSDVESWVSRVYLMSHVTNVQGAPHSLADLEKVAAGQARTVILMHPDNIEVG